MFIIFADAGTLVIFTADEPPLKRGVAPADIRAEGVHCAFGPAVAVFVFVFFEENTGAVRFLFEECDAEFAFHKVFFPVSCLLESFDIVSFQDDIHTATAAAAEASPRTVPVSDRTDFSVEDQGYHTSCGQQQY